MSNDRTHRPRTGSAGWTNALIGWTLYPLGDLAAQLILGQVDVHRLIILALVGGLIYRYEVPAWFNLLDGVRFSHDRLARQPWLRALARPAEGVSHRLNWLGKTLGAMLYFNPLWIARHVFFIMLATTAWSGSNLVPALGTALVVGSKSFATNLPLSLAGNYLIQERLPLKYRFFGSVTMSGLLAVKYALELTYFA